MLKKILLVLLLFGIFFSPNVFAIEGDEVKIDEVKICEDNPQNKINCSDFMIDSSIFSPGGIKILQEARKGNNGNTVKSANAIFSVIIKNLIVVFGVLSLLMMTIGGGMMIFHAGQESLLTKGKLMFIWGIASLAIGLSAGLIVKLVSYFLY